MIDFNQAEVVSPSSLVKYIAWHTQEPRLNSINAVILECNWFLEKFFKFC